MLIKLLGYNYTVEYKRGKQNKAADALSRATHAQLLPITSVVPAWIEQVVNSYEQNQKCQELIAQLSIDGAVVPSFSLQSGIIRHNGKVVIGDNENLKKQLLDSFHMSALGGHSGERATYPSLKLIFYWPKMNQHVKEYVKACLICQKNKVEHTPYPGLLKPLPVPDMAGHIFPWTLWKAFPNQTRMLSWWWLIDLPNMPIS